MHGTVVMLMALSGLGCHHKHADVAYVPSCYTSSFDSCYSSSCYSSYQPSCYSGCYSSADYIGGCYSSCYSETSYVDPWPSCYSEKRCFLKKLFHGGLFKKHHRKAYAPIETSCYSSCYSGCYSSVYEPPVFGTSMPIYETPYASTQVPSKSMYSAPATAPAAPAPPVPSAPTVAPKATAPEATSGTSTPPPPPPTPASAVEDAVNSLTPDAPVPAPNAQP